MRRWPQSPELREQGEPGLLGHSASVLGFPSNLVSTHSAPIASASVPLMLHRTLTLRSGPPTQGCHNPVSNKSPSPVPTLSCSIQRVRTAERPQGGAPLAPIKVEAPTSNNIFLERTFSSPPSRPAIYFWHWFRASSWTADPRIHAGIYCPPPAACSAGGGGGA